MAATDDIKNENAADDRSREESVDEILAGILNADGSFNEEFGGLLNKYLGADSSHLSSLRGVDLSDRMDEPSYYQRVEYEEPDMRRNYEKSTDRRIEERLPENTRAMYYEAAADAQRPEFTYGGGVRYPAMGIGASEERVVYDADWEERARHEAARLQRVREDRMLRGDSTYVRSFVAGGRSMDGRGGYRGSPYIDPLSADEDFDDPYMNDRRREEKRSFFQEGPPVRSNAYGQRGAGYADGRTREHRYYGAQSDYGERYAGGPSWMQPDSANSDGRKKHRNNQHQKTSTLREDYDRLSILRENEGSPRIEQNDGKLTQPKRVKKAAPEKKEVKAAQSAKEEAQKAEKTSEDLRSTVAEIVDKYNKKNEEEAAARLKALEEEQKKAEDERRKKEAFIKTLPEVLVKAIREDEKEDDNAGYDDFSGFGEQPSGEQPSGEPAPVISSSEEGDFSLYLENIDAEPSGDGK